MKSIWKCRPPGGGHFGVGFINQALLAKVSPLDKVSFCGTVKPLLLVGIPSNKMERGLSSQLPECVFYDFMPKGNIFACARHI